MKKFHFPLDRVLAWRRTQVRMERTNLERMLIELRQVETRSALVRRELEQSNRAVIGAPFTFAGELEAMEAFRKLSATRTSLLLREQAGWMERVQAQRAVITRKELEVRLLEKLREDRWRAWSVAQDREIDQQAEEGYLARWNRPG